MEVPGPLEIRRYDSSEAHPEVRDLRILAQSGFEVAPIVVVPPSAQSQFYRLNNLDERLREMFSRVNTSDPDDDDIEELAPAAQRLVEGHYLLDEFIDTYYEAIRRLPAELRVRRPGNDGDSFRRGRQSLLGIKKTWGSDWTFEAIWSRLRATHQLLPAAAATLVHSSQLVPLQQHLDEDASALLGRPVALLGDPDSGVTGLRYLTAPDGDALQG